MVKKTEIKKTKIDKVNLAKLQVEAINTSNAYIDPEDYNVLIFSN